MMSDVERYGEAVDWQPAPPPQRVTIEGRTVRLEPLQASRHGPDLYRASGRPDADPEQWAYLAIGPFTSEDDFVAEITARETTLDPLFFAIVDPASGEARGMAALMRIDPANGVAEVGHIWLGPTLRQTTAATEAIFLFADYVLGRLGYRRFEWKCNHRNARSRRAADRYGFTYEGIFRQHMVIKGRNRDTAWYAMLDREWSAIRAGFVAWLDPGNFDADGRQRRTLEECRTNP